MTAIEIPKATLTQILFDLSDGDDEFVSDLMDIFDLTPPSEEGMRTERALSDIRLSWSASIEPIISMISAVAAKISVCSNLDESATEDDIIDDITNVAAVNMAVIRTAFGHIAQQVLVQEQNCQTTSG